MDQNNPLHTLIGACPIFQNLSEAEIALLAANSAIESIEEGQTIFQEGDPAEVFLFVASGEVVIRQRQDKHRSRDVARYVPGEPFGEMDVLRRSTRSAEAVAATAGTLLTIPNRSTTFASLVHENPEQFAGILSKLIAYVAGRIRTANELLGKKSSLVTEIRRQVYTDKLTGLYNSTYLKDALGSFAAAEKKRSAVLVCKPDRFKDLNDRYGHGVGDAVLQLVAHVFREDIQSIGIPVRTRGNELVALLPGLGREKARKLARKLQSRIRKIDLFPLTEDRSLRITVSIAIAAAPEDLERGGRSTADEGIPRRHDRRKTIRTGESPGAHLFDIAVHRITEAREGPGDALYDGSSQS